MAIIALNTQYSPNRGKVFGCSAEDYDRLIREPWLATAIDKIRGGDENEKGRLPFMCPHFSEFKDNRRAQSCVIPEAFTWHTMVDIDDKEKLLKELKKNRKREINIGMTDFGIHRDDYEFIHNDNNAKEYSSQGLQKLIVLAMKLSEVQIFINNYEIYPILLLDDLFSELDEKNRNNIFKSLDKNIQIFITTTDLKNINKNIIKKAKIYDLDKEV